MPLRRLTAILIGALVVPVLLVAAGSLAARQAQSTTLDQLDQLERMRLADQQLLTAMVEQQSGARGYIDTEQAEFLTQYSLGLSDYSSALSVLRTGSTGAERRQLEATAAAAAAWQAWASERVDQVSASNRPLVDPGAAQKGQQLFDRFRSADAGFAGALLRSEASDTARTDRRTAGLAVLIVALLVINLGIAGAVAAILLWRVVGPVEALAAAAAGIAAGRTTSLPHRDRRDEIGGLANSLEEWRRAADARLGLARDMVEVSQRTDLAEVLKLGADRLLQVLGGAQVVITVIGPSGPVVAASHPHPFDPRSFRMDSPGGAAMSLGTVVITSVTESRWDPEIRAWAARRELGPAAGMPMMVAGELVGAATVLRRLGQDPFTESDVEWAMLVLPPLAAAVRSASLLEELAASNLALSRADAYKSQFLANMSHELRTPLNSILGFTDLLLSRHAPSWNDSKAERFLGIIRSSGQDLLTLINDILDLSKISAGRVTIDPDRFAIGGLALQVVQSVEALTRGKELRVDLDIDEGLLLVGDPRLLRQLLLNLVSNAIKFTPNGGTLGVSVAGRDGRAILTVTDSGIGIAAEDQARIFSAFEQVTSAAAGQGQGTGLGLALAKRIAELHHGSIAIESEPGAGSRFIVDLPLNALAGPTMAEDTEPEPASDPGRSLILIVEDDADAIALLREQVSGAGYEVAIARDGEEALAKARRLRPAAITLDVVLPKIHGWDLLSRLKEDPVTRGIPVLVVSVVDNPTLARALGAADYLVKPVDQDVLATTLKRALDGHDRPSARILAIDDSAGDLEWLAARLGDAGYVVATTTDAAAGLELARADPPEAILLDLVMPGMSGFEVLTALRDEPATREVPTIILTAKELTGEERDFLTGRAATVLAKDGDASQGVVGLLRKLVRTGQRAQGPA